MPLKHESSTRAHTLLCAYSNNSYPHVSANESLRLSDVFNAPSMPARPLTTDERLSKADVRLSLSSVKMVMVCSLASAHDCNDARMLELLPSRAVTSKPNVLPVLEQYDGFGHDVVTP